ncbi:hypothetical protein BOTBODRAFT_179542 [Botryobasidium botryosum FD-172 SS1]|uniref:Uncharacterized protein n=1 Tax=Botryobasidium botryosum (strain FD-172 SS1) TaxID=930990 RepID=A0A067MA71_BOTB1|nr:hypothetical protein BOTBODRAFT_179542 [Botryobasidium botryosum FD-172 SS1]
MIAKGATMRRVLDSQELATQIVSSLINFRRLVVLSIQKEILGQCKSVLKTAAGREQQCLAQLAREAEQRMKKAGLQAAKMRFQQQELERFQAEGGVIVVTISSSS